MFCAVCSGLGGEGGEGLFEFGGGGGGVEVLSS